MDRVKLMSVGNEFIGKCDNRNTIVGAIAEDDFNK